MNRANFPLKMVPSFFLIQIMTYLLLNYFLIGHLPFYLFLVNRYDVPVPVGLPVPVDNSLLDFAYQEYHHSDLDLCPVLLLVLLFVVVVILVMQLQLSV